MLIFNKIHFNSFDKHISFLKKKKKEEEENKQIRMTQMQLILTYLIKGKSCHAHFIAYSMNTSFEIMF